MKLRYWWPTLTVIPIFILIEVLLPWTWHVTAWHAGILAASACWNGYNQHSGEQFRRDLAVMRAHAAQVKNASMQ